MNACMDVVRVVEGQSYLAVRSQNPSNEWVCTILQRFLIHRAVVVIKLFPKTYMLHLGQTVAVRTRALELMMRLLLESEEVRPSLVQSLFDYMKQKLRDAKEIQS